MARELSAAVTAVKNAQRFTYYDYAEIRLPFGPGDTDGTPVFRVSTAEIEVVSILQFDEWTYVVFQGALNRPPQSAELTDWVDALESARATSEAAFVAEAQDRLDALFTSLEYTDRMRNDTQYVQDLYASYLGRVAEEGGLDHWVGEVGTDGRDLVRAAFAAAPEFLNRLESMTVPAVVDSDARDMGDLSFSDGAAIDGVDFVLANNDDAYGRIIGQSGRRLYPAPAVVGRAFRVADGSYETVEKLRGFAKFSAVDGGSARVTIVSDMSRRGVDMVEIDSQRCRNIYKDEGCDSPDASPTCSRLLNDAVNGCAAKAAAPQIEDTTPPDNRPSFRGTPRLSPSPTTGAGIEPGITGPGGWPPGEYDPDDPRVRRGRSLEEIALL